MPTSEVTDRFKKDCAGLPSADRARFRRTILDQFVIDLASGQGFRAGLRVKRVQRTTAVWEMTWSPDGRATWQYGAERLAGHVHVVWRRVGTHDILRTS